LIASVRQPCASLLHSSTPQGSPAAVPDPATTQPLRLFHERFYIVAGGSAKTFLNRFADTAIDGVIFTGNRIERIDETGSAHVFAHGIGAIAIDDPAHPAPAPVCLDHSRSDLAAGDVVLVRLDDPAFGFLARWWRPLADPWSFEPLHQRFALSRPFAVEVLDDHGRLRMGGFLAQADLAQSCAVLGEAGFADDFEDR